MLLHFFKSKSCNFIALLKCVLGFQFNFYSKLCITHHNSDTFLTDQYIVIVLILYTFLKSTSCNFLALLKYVYFCNTNITTIQFCQFQFHLLLFTEQMKCLGWQGFSINLQWWPSNVMLAKNSSPWPVNVKVKTKQ